MLDLACFGINKVAAFELSGWMNQEILVIDEMEEVVWSQAPVLLRCWVVWNSVST